MSVEDSFDQEKLIECLNQQLSELEIFQTMYSPREIDITNTEVLDCIRAFVARITDYSPNHLDYTIKFDADIFKLELSINLPSLYPEEAPEIYVRCNELNRTQEKSLNTELIAYLRKKHDGEVCIFTAISWLQDNIDRFAKIALPIALEEENKSEGKFTRCWIYSHHIFNKKKIEEITKQAKEYNLTGFCLVGKPGIICIEGEEEDCKMWWRIIKALNWLKIVLRISESFGIDERQYHQKFKTFNTIKFQSPITGHTDIGKFQKYVETYGLLAQATEFLGVYPSS